MNKPGLYHGGRKLRSFHLTQRSNLYGRTVVVSFGRRLGRSSSRLVVVLFGRRHAWSSSHLVVISSGRCLDRPLVVSSSLIIVSWVYRRHVDEQTMVLYHLHASMPRAHSIQFVCWQLHRALAVSLTPSQATV